MRKYRSLVIAQVAIIVTMLAANSRWMFAGGREPTSAGAGPIAATNPHWKTSGCASCHGADAGQASSIPHAAVDLLCLGCHDGVKASREAHPIGRSFAGDQVRRPAGWPAPDGRLSCITCHDVLTGCHADARRPSRNPAFLRLASNTNVEAFCAHCHVETPHERLNPHFLGHGAAEGQNRACLVCHSPTILDRPRNARTSDAALIADEATLCGRCHTRHFDYFDPGHLGARVNGEMLAHLRQLDARHGFASRAGPAVMPLAPNDTVTCSSCHNAHSEGVFPSGSILAIGAMLVNPSSARAKALRVHGQEFCGACHAN